jgi:ribulose-phosphate 3-epimerase
MFEVVPGVLEKEWAEIEKKIEAVLPFAKTIHVDLIDGKFRHNHTFADPTPFAKYAKDVKLELHMMVEDPIAYLKPWADAGFQRFIGHIEKMSDQAEFVAQAQLLGEVALAIDLKTPLDEIKVNLEDLDSLLVMSVETGHSGQQFEEEVMQKVKQIREKHLYLPIEVDGGVNDETIQIAAADGATRFVATSFLHTMGTPASQYNLLMEKLKELTPAA